MKSLSAAVFDVHDKTPSQSYGSKVFDSNVRAVSFV